MARKGRAPLQFNPQKTLSQKRKDLVSIMTHYERHAHAGINWARTFQVNQRALRLWLLCLALACTAACSQGNRDEQARMQKEIEELKEGQRQIQEQLKQLKGDQLLKRIAPSKSETPFDIEVDKSSAESKGNEGARVAVIEFTDFQCSYCLDRKSVV